MRDLYVESGTNRIVRFNETLSTGSTDFFNFTTGLQEEVTFTAPLRNCVNVSVVGEAVFLRSCRKYAGMGRLSYLGYG